MGIRLGSVVVVIAWVVACGRSPAVNEPQPDLDSMRMYEPLAMRTEAKLPDHAVILGTDAKGGSTVLRIPTTQSTSSVDAAMATAQVRVKLTTTANADGEVHVGIFEERVGTNSTQWRASVWVAATVAAHTLGKDLTDFTFGASAADSLDGPSASGLIAGGFLATMTGAKIDPAATLIGVIDPDGTIGPVDGLAEKLHTAIAAGKKTIGYPAGMVRVKAAGGAEVNVVDVAKAGGATAVEVGNVHDAYKLLTGKALPATIPVTVEAMAIEPDRVAAIGVKYDLWSAKVAARASALAELQRAAKVPKALIEIAKLAKENADRAAELRKKGAIAPALAAIIGAWAYAVAATDSYTVLVKAKAGDKAGAVAALVDLDQLEVAHSLETVAAMRPNTIGGHVQMMGAYQNALRGAVFAAIAQNRVDLAKDALESRVASDDDLAAGVLTAKMLVVRSVVDSTLAVQRLEFETGKSVGYMCSVPNVIRLATSYRSAATAGMSYLDSVMIEPLAKSASITIEEARGRMATSDPDYLVAYSLAHLDDVAASVKSQFGETSLAWNLLLLAGAERAYADAAELSTKHYAFADGVRHDGAVASLLVNSELAARASARAAEVATGAIPVQAKMAYQLANAQRDAGDKLAALTSYWAATAYSQTTVMLARN